MECINKVEIRGVVGNVRTFPGNDGTARSYVFSVVTNYAYHSKANGGVIEATWFNVTAWPSRSIKETELTKLERGAKVQVTGRLREDNYTDRDGVPHYSYGLVAYTLSVLEGEEPISPEMNM